MSTVNTQTILIDPDGTIRFVYDDRLEPLLGEGAATVRRASHVEPCGDGEDVRGWTADLSPVGGPVLGPYRWRSMALAAEREWIEANLLHGGSDHGAGTTQDDQR